MSHERSRQVLLCALLACAVVAVYGQVYTHAFVEYDDPAYVSENPFVRRGLTWQGVRWAFTTGHMGNWNPLTWLSHMLDVQLFGLNPGAHHLVNVALHLANALLLFGVLQRMTRALGPSFIVAALFALHPLHVESVAWISERKDVLSTLFWLLTLWAYARYVEARSSRWYAAAAASFAAGLMAKPMLVTVPFVLLLLDVWPLRRLVSSADGTPRNRRERHRGTRRTGVRAMPLTALLWEKAPLLGLTAICSAVAYGMQLRSGAVVEAGALPVGLRVANALVAYVRYLAMTVWPVDLAVLYPYDVGLPLWQPAGAALVIGVVSILVLRGARRHPYALMGWLWYLGTLVPVIGLVQIGSQALADRYTYVPLIGVFVMVAWGGQSLVARWGLPAPAVLALVTGTIGAYGVLARTQVELWRNGETLLSHTIRVTRANCIAHNNLGVALAAQGETEAALEYFREALRIKPDYADAHNNLGNALRGLGETLRDTGRLTEAIEHYEQALRFNPEFADAHYNLGIALTQAGRLQEAIERYQQALRLEPEYPQAHNNLGNALADVGRLEEAIGHYREVLRLEPDFPDAHYNLAIALAESGRFGEAIAQYQQALRLRPDFPSAHYNFGIALTHAGQLEEAIGHFHEALRLEPDFPEAQHQLGIALTEAGRFPEAIGRFQQALQLKPDYAEALNDLGVALVHIGQLHEAIGYFENALRLNPDLPDAQYNLEVARARTRNVSVRTGANEDDSADTPIVP